MRLPKKYYEIKKHYRRFGRSGTNFYKELNSKKDIITFSAPEYKYPIWLRNGTSDINAFYDVLFRQEYRLKKEFDPKIIIDLGANIGLTSIFYKNMYPDASIIAIEADKGNFQLMSRNLFPYKDIITYNKAIWNKSTTLSIADNGLGHWGYEVNEQTNSSGHAVESVSMDDILDTHNIEQIDVLKIDIEGSEKELFDSNYENWLPKVRSIVIELHDHMRENCSKSFFKAISNFDYKLSILGENYFIEFR